MLSSPLKPESLHIWIQRLCSPSNYATASHSVLFLCQHGNSKGNKKREHDGERWQNWKGQWKRAVCAEAWRTESETTKRHEEWGWWSAALRNHKSGKRAWERIRDEGETRGRIGEEENKHFEESEPVLDIWESVHTLCSVGTICLPGLDLQACRKMHPASPYPKGCAVTVGPDLPVDGEGSPGTDSVSVSESVC